MLPGSLQTVCRQKMSDQPNVRLWFRK